MREPYSTSLLLSDYLSRELIGYWPFSLSGSFHLSSQSYWVKMGLVKVSHSASASICSVSW